jgi:hypothetical protein
MLKERHHGLGCHKQTPTAQAHHPPAAGKYIAQARTNYAHTSPLSSSDVAMLQSPPSGQTPHQKGAGVAHLSLKQLERPCLLQLLEHLAQVAEAASRNLHEDDVARSMSDHHVARY